MRLLQVTAACLVGLLLAGAGAAQTAPVTPTKIAFVDVEKAVALIEEGKARFLELQGWARPRQDELAKLNSEVNQLGEELNAKRGAVADAELGELNRRLVAKQREFEDKQRIAKRDFEAKQSVVLRELGGKLNEVISRYARETGYDAVFILKANDVAYLSASIDITDTVIKLYNEKYPGQPAKSGEAGK
jgi:outer membrane protein